MELYERIRRDSRLEGPWTARWPGNRRRGTGRIPRRPPPTGETVTGGQGVGMVRAQDP